MTSRTRVIDLSMICCALLSLALIANEALAGGTKCRTNINLGTNTISCSGQACIGQPTGTCVDHTFQGFPRDVTVYQVTWHGGVATVTALYTILAPGAVGAQVRTCACQDTGEGGAQTWGDDWCCDAVLAKESATGAWVPATMGTCSTDGCTQTGLCALVVHNDGFTAEAECGH
jgi:hypothetical protein